jgi:hypothetical protein
MILGFTGTREEPSKAQRLWLVDYLLEHTPSEFHHGCCRGSDAFAHRAAKQCDIKGPIQIILHPPSNSKDEMKYEDWDYANCVWWPKKPYADRNYDIVGEAEGMIAFPKGPEQQRGSGTWQTIRATLRAKKPIILVYPDGKIEMKSGAQ